MAYKIPLFDLNYGTAEEEAVLKVLRSKWISMGPQVQQLEEAFSANLSVKNSVAVSNCTAALHLALKVLGIGKGDEVIVPSLTFVATANVVRYVDATPVFADITSLKDYSIDPADIEKKITPQTKVIIVMHYGGFSCDMDAIRHLAKQHNLYIVEDAAHAPYAEYKGEKLGTIGDIGCFSFFSNKNITCAEGGMLVTNNDNFAEKAKLLRAHGMTTLSFDRAKGHSTRYDVLDSGYNYRLDDIRGALALSQLKKLKADIEKRKELRGIYLEKLGTLDEIILPYKNFKYESSNYIFPILLKDGNAQKRDFFREELKNRGIQTSIHYPAVHLFSVYKDFCVPLPKTEYVTANEITLPLYFSLKPQDINYIATEISKIAIN